MALEYAPENGDQLLVLHFLHPTGPSVYLQRIIPKDASQEYIESTIRMAAEEMIRDLRKAKGLT